MATLRRLASRQGDVHAGKVAGMWIYREGRRHRRREAVARLFKAACVVFAVAVIALGIGAFRARAHYLRGQQALAAGSYDRAAAEFGAASILSVGYGQADALREASLVEARNDAAPLRYRLTLNRTLRQLRDGSYFSAAIGISILRRWATPCSLDFGRHGARSLAKGGDALLAIAAQRFRERRWMGARAYATAALYLQPNWDAASEIEQLAYRYMVGG